MKEIILTHGHVALVDDEDYEKLSGRNWHTFISHQGRKTLYAATKGKFITGKVSPILMHRVILGLTDPKIQVDHEDGDGLNNQKYNLRICNNSQNNANRKKYKLNSSRYKGVRFIFNGWNAQITKDKKAYYLGMFKTENEAAIAYNKKAIELHGEFASINEIV